MKDRVTMTSPEQVLRLVIADRTVDVRLASARIQDCGVEVIHCIHLVR